MDDRISQITPADLRGILNYVPRFLGQTFVISLDGSIIDNPNLPNILLDIAVLRSLQIKVVIAHGISKQLTELASERDIAISNADGTGPTNPATLKLAIRASSRVSHQILEALTQTGLKCAITNSVRATSIGVLKGVDYERSGRVDRIDAEFLGHLISQNIIPIIQPIGFDRNGHTLRVNSDLMAIETAFALRATKAIFVSNMSGIEIDGELKRQLPVDTLASRLDESPDSVCESSRSKARHAVAGVEGGISRIHILDGNIHDGLVREVFSAEGVGTLVYGNEYQQIRQANRADVPRIYHLTSGSVEKEELARRSIDSIEAEVNNFYVYEIDGNLVGCVLISRFQDDSKTAEINALFVHSLHQRQGIGSKLVNYACLRASEWGCQRILALSTQSVGFFSRVGGFSETGASALPPNRLTDYEAQNRKSKILVKDLPTQ